MRIGTVEISSKLALAPMAGVTDAAFRQICSELGAGYTITELISSKALCYHDKKTFSLLTQFPGEHPAAVQIFGSDPVCMAEAAQIAMEHTGADILDINMGCPAPKIAGPGAGSALLKDPPLAGAIARAVRDAAPADVPVTVKLRIGWDADTMTGLEVARRCADAGAALLTVHGRTRAEMYNPGIHPEEIAKIKAAVDIPVLANGDVTDAESALALLAATGCDGVAVGRGAMGNPWLFGQIAAAMECREVPPPPSLHERFRVLRRHIYDMCEDKGEYIAMQQARTHAAWYMHGLRGAATLRRECCGMLHFTDLDRVIEHAWELQRETR